MTMPLEVADPPVKGPEETQADFAVRHLVWYHEADIIRRGQCLAKPEQLAAAFGPTLDKVEAAWSAFDGRLDQLAKALQGAGGTIPTTLFIEVLRLILDKPATSPLPGTLNLTGDSK
jgi:hypothetical protein